MLRIVHDAGTQGELEDERVDLDDADWRRGR